MVLVNYRIAMAPDVAEPASLRVAVQALEGRAAATFVVLAGVGMSLRTRRAREAGDPAALRQERRVLWRRAAFLFVAGLAYMPLWQADILHYYGVYLTIGAALLAAPTRRLLQAAVAVGVGFVALLLVLDYERGWDWDTLTYQDLWTPAGMLRNLLFNGFHPVVPWVAFLLVGMALGRLDLRQVSRRRRVLVLGLGIALAGEGLSRLLTATLAGGASPDESDLAALLGAAAMPPTPLYLLAASGTACAVIAAAVSLGEIPALRRALAPLVATGQLALTLYVAHVVLGMGLLEALGRLEDQSLGFSVLAAAVFFGVSVLFATLWRRRFRQGPLEALMRRLT